MTKFSVAAQLPGNENFRPPACRVFVATEHPSSLYMFCARWLPGHESRFRHQSLLT
jgi:hypothetical protein